MDVQFIEKRACHVQVGWLLALMLWGHPLHMLTCRHGHRTIALGFLPCPTAPLLTTLTISATCRQK